MIANKTASTILAIALIATPALAQKHAKDKDKPVDAPVAAASTTAASEHEVIEQIDRAERTRERTLSGYTVTEHYVIKNNRMSDPLDAVVTVVYKSGEGKTYTVVSNTGHGILNKVFNSLLDSEKRLSTPAARKDAIITSDNYKFTLTGQEKVGGRLCNVLTANPVRKNDFTLHGRIWVDAENGLMVKLDGIPGASPSFLSGKPHVVREYGEQHGFSLARHSHATTSSFISGDTTVDIDYTGYSLTH